MKILNIIIGIAVSLYLIKTVYLPKFQEDREKIKTESDERSEKFDNKTQQCARQHENCDRVNCLLNMLKEEPQEHHCYDIAISADLDKSEFYEDRTSTQDKNLIVTEEGCKSFIMWTHFYQGSNGKEGLSKDVSSAPNLMKQWNIFSQCDQNLPEEQQVFAKHPWIKSILQ